VLLAAILALVWGCGPPELDTSSAPALVKSLTELEESVEPDRREAFRDAVAYLTDDATVGLDVGPVEPFLEAFAPLDGLTADAIVTMAWMRRVNELKGNITDLEARAADGAAAQALIDRVELSEVRLFPHGGAARQRPMVEAVVLNRTRSALFGISFQASLRPVDEDAPTVTEVVDRPFDGGIAPGQRLSVRFELENSSWKHTLETDPDAAFLCGITRLMGRRGRVLAATDYGPTDVFLHALWTRQLEALLDDPPEGVSVS
jgi:hypothetical protein